MEIKEEELRPGYNYDPYKDEGAECDDVISHLFEPMTGRGGLFSTWRERHIAIMGACAGLRAGTLDVVPPCPPLFIDEQQYWDGCAMITNVAKSNWPGVLGTLAGTFIALKSVNII